VCVCQAIMAAPDFVAFKETPDAEKPVPPCGHKTRVESRSGRYTYCAMYCTTS